MPSRRHRFQHVEYARGMRPSALRLDRALIAAGYAGPSISWGLHGSNKRLQLEALRAAGVPTPARVEPADERWPIVGRSDQHRAGQGFWFCTSQEDCVSAQARPNGATHFMQYLWPAREFRVHIVHAESIKLTEKVNRNPTRYPITHPVIRSHENGWVHNYPHEFGHRVTLRRTAKAAVEALGLTHGAVDILWHNDEPYVLEVNNAPALTSANDTLDRYIQAFLRST